MGDNTQHDTADDEHGNRVADIESGALGVSFAHGQIKGRGAADAEHQRDGDADGCQRKGNVCRSVAKSADAPADKYLIDNVIQCTDQHGNDAGNGKIAQQSADFFCF